MPAPTPEMNRFIERLIRATKAGKVNWKQTNRHWFVVKGGPGSITINSEGQGGHPFVFRLWPDPQNSNYQLESAAGQHYEEWEEQLAILYEAARDAALRIDETLRSWEQELGLDKDPSS